MTVNYRYEVKFPTSGLVVGVVGRRIKPITRIIAVDGISGIRITKLTRTTGKFYATIEYLVWIL